MTTDIITPMQLADLRRQVEEVALQAGRFLKESRLNFDGISIQSKHSHDYVTDIDRQSEQLIVSRLKALLPEAGFITEEKTVEQEVGQHDVFWVIDPLDGTTNYIHDLAPYCVSIALRTEAEILLGVVYEPSRDELFSAALHQGATLNGQRIQVTDTADIDQCLVMIGYPYNADEYRPFALKMTERLYGHCASLRSMGSAEAELCYLAAGRIDVYFESFIQPWDVAAGACIVKEAGGTVTDYAGADKLWQSGRQVLATNGKVHGQMADIISKSE